MKEQIQMFESKKVRTVWDDEKEEWYFSIVDVVSVLNETDYQNARKYWKVLKGRLIKEGFEVVTNCYQLKLVAPDGKGRLTDVATPEQLFRIIQSIPNKKAEPFKQWMAQVAAKNGGVARNNGIGVKTDDLFEKISTLIEESRKKVATAVNVAEVYTKYEIGRYIVEDELNGQNKAKYGKKIIQTLSQRLTDRFGDGWSEEVLQKARKFYSVYSSTGILSTSKIKSLSPRKSQNFVHGVDKIQNAPAVPHKFVLSWSHYLVLMRVDNADARSFYEIEAAKENWSVRWLQRQVGSSLYERIALSKDKDEVIRLAAEGQTIEKASDIIKNPITLEFLGLKPEAAYSETKLEAAIISKLQTFLLELGKGFLFEARQKRFTFDEDDFYVDLVFYNRLLQCYVLIDLKIDKLTHQDLGQMQMYVNYYDRYVRQEFEKPTVGILLCRKKNDTLVELTLPKDANIYAAQYELYLPDKKELQEKLRSWVEEFENEVEGGDED